MLTQLHVGRARERAELLALLREHAAVALVGAAGIGKSALLGAALPEAIAVSLAGARDAAEIVARTAAAAPDGATVAWEDEQDAAVDAAAQALAEVALRWRVVIVSRRVPAELPRVTLGPLSPEEHGQLVQVIEAARRWVERAAPETPLSLLHAGRFAELADTGSPLAVAALIALGELDRAEALLGPDGAPPLRLLLDLGRGRLRDVVAAAPALEARATDPRLRALILVVAARAALGLGDVAQAEAQLRRAEVLADGFAPEVRPLVDLGAMLVAAFRGDWSEARRRAVHAHEAAPAVALLAVERWWAAGGPVPPGLDGAARALYDLRAAERALADGALDDANRHARDAERFFRAAGATYDRTLALVARAEATARAGDATTARKLSAAGRALAVDGGYRIARVALDLVDAALADRAGDLAGYVAALAAARTHAGDDLSSAALGDACARVGLPRPAAVAEGQPLRDRVARLTLGRRADGLCTLGDELRLRSDDEPPPDADAVAHLDDGTLSARGRELALPPQLMQLLATIGEAGSDGATPEELYLLVWNARDYHPLRHRNAVYVALNRLRDALAPVLGREALRSTATHYALAPGVRVAVLRAVKRLGVDGFRARPTLDGDGARAYALRHRVALAQARWELALHAATTAADRRSPSPTTD